MLERAKEDQKTMMNIPLLKKDKKVIFRIKRRPAVSKPDFKEYGKEETKIMINKRLILKRSKANQK